MLCFFSVSLAKEKWRNLRSVFVRKRKLPPSGSGKKGKPYYLGKYMEFLLPYIKINTIEHGNVPSPPSVRDTIVEENYGDNITEQENVLNENTQTNELPTGATTSQTSMPKKRKTDKLNEVDKSLIEFFHAKKKKVTASEISSNPRRQFLESLLPEVDEMPETTFRQFKRQVLQLIDRLNSNTFNPIPFSPATHSLHSQSPSLHYSNPSSVASSHILSPEPNLYELPPVSSASLFMPVTNKSTQSVDLQSVLFSPLTE